MRRSIDTLILNLTFGIGALLLVLMMVQISVNAVLRAVFGAQLPATVEIVSNYYMVGFSFLPMALAQIKGRHIDASFLHARLGNGLRTAANWLSQILSVGVVGLIIYQSYIDAVKKTKIGAYAVSGTSEIPIWICYWVLPISFTLLLIAMLFFPFTQRSDEEGVQV